MNKLWTDFKFWCLQNNLKKYDLFSQIMNSIKRKLKLINEIWILTTWWITNMCMTHEYNQFWLQSKSVNSSIKRSCWLNMKCEITNYSIMIILSFQTSNFYNLRFLNLLTMSQLLNIQITWKLTKLYNNSITDSWCMTLWENMYNSVQHALEKKTDIWKNKMYYNSCSFLCDDDETSWLTLSLIYQIAMTIQMSW